MQNVVTCIIFRNISEMWCSKLQEVRITSLCHHIVKSEIIRFASKQWAMPIWENGL